MFATGGVMAACAGSACMTATCSCFGAVGGAIAKISARALYVALFVLTTVLAVVMRDYAKPMLAKLPWIVHAAGGAAGFEPGDEWFGAQAVYRVSLGAFFFFAAMSLLLVDVRDRSDPRDKAIQHGNWTLKTVAWVTCLVAPFFLNSDSEVITVYVWFARVASGLFLCAQSLILLDFAFLWNAQWLRNSEDASNDGDQKTATAWILGLLLGTIILFAGALTLFAFLFTWYVPRASGCETNKWLISVTVVLVVVCALVSAHPAAAERGASVLPAAVVAAYCAYLTHAALASEPGTTSSAAGVGKENASLCVPVRKSAGGAGRAELNELAGAALTLLSVAYSALRCGSADFFGDGDGDADSGDVATRGLLESHDTNGDAVNGDDSDVGGAGAAFPNGPVRYSYSFFHAVFALASAYLGMLLTGWGARGDGDAGGGDIRDVDSGWASVWVKIVSAWITSLLYAWTVAAPFVMEDRDFT